MVSILALFFVVGVGFLVNLKLVKKNSTILIQKSHSKT